MSLQEAIVSNSEILGGMPVFRNTRVPVKNLFDYLNAGEPYTAFLADFYFRRTSIGCIGIFKKQFYNS